MNVGFHFNISSKGIEPTKKDRKTHKEEAASQHRRRITEETISLNVGMLKKSVSVLLWECALRMRERVNA